MKGSTTAADHARTDERGLPLPLQGLQDLGSAGFSFLFRDRSSVSQMVQQGQAVGQFRCRGRGGVLPRLAWAE